MLQKVSYINKLPLTQLADALRTWYIFRERAVKDEFGLKYSEIGSCQCLWFNRNIRSKSKQYFLHEDWLDKGLIFVSDLLDPPLPGSK